MIEVERIAAAGQVVRLRVARRLLGLANYYTAAYWVDGLLVDTGCAHTAAHLVLSLGDLGVDQVINKHSHEDHIGTNADVQETFECPILAHPDALPIWRTPGCRSCSSIDAFTGAGPGLLRASRSANG